MKPPRPAPVALFAYKRLEHLRRTLDSLINNELSSETDLTIFSDGPRRPEDVDAVQSVRSYVRTLGHFRSVRVIEHQANQGLAQSVISGVTQMCAEYGKVIVVEDDLETSRFFLRYMNEALDLYESVQEVVSIHGYMYPVTENLPETFFIRGADCWGWATWSRAWSLFNPDGKALLSALVNSGQTHEFDFNGNNNFTSMLKSQVDGKIDSWAIRWYASAFLAHKLTLYPKTSLVRNIGMDGSGTHGDTTEEFEVGLSQKNIHLEPLAPVQNQDAWFSIAKSHARQLGRAYVPPVSPPSNNSAPKLVSHVSPDEIPHMDEAGFQMWSTTLHHADSYLEYGAGKSTIFASKHLNVGKIISVDSDMQWLARILSTTSGEGASKNVSLLHANIGKIGEWGVPLNRDSSKSFHEYITLPWQFAAQENISPTVVLVDGRFRVACFLYSLIASTHGATLLFDDYNDRPEYHLVERHCEITERAGRMARFVNRKTYSIPHLTRDLLQYAQDWD